MEHQLCDHFFPISSLVYVRFAPLLDPLCTIVYDTLWASFIHETNLDLLCELVVILKDEVFDEQLGNLHRMSIFQLSWRK